MTNDMTIYILVRLQTASHAMNEIIKEVEEEPEIHKILKEANDNIYHVMMVCKKQLGL